MSQEITVKELIYELGNDARVLEFHFKTTNVFGPDFDYGAQQKYTAFKTRALKLGVELPDLPEDGPNQAFFNEQIIKVTEYIKLNKTESMARLFLVGSAAERLLKWLDIARILSHKTPEEKLSKKLEKIAKYPNRSLQDLIEEAKELGVAIGDQLKAELKDICENYENLRFDQDFDENSIRVRLMNTLCGPSSGCKRSKIDPTRVITDECWAISLVRLPDSSNAEHAFLVLEGKEGRKSKIWFADFVAKQWVDAVLPGTEDGKVRMEYHEAEGDPTTTLLFKCQKKMMSVRATDRLLYSTWLIDKTTADKLIKMIEEKQKKPPKFHALGNTSVLAAISAMLSSNPTGHNSFTFAKMMLRDLNDPYIQLPEDDLDTWIVSATSRYLVDNREARRPWYKTPSFQLIFVFLVGVFVAFFLSKAFYPKI